MARRDLREEFRLRPDPRAGLIVEREESVVEE